MDASLTPERIFAAPDLSGPDVMLPAFSPDGTRVSYLKPNTEHPEILELWVASAYSDEPARRVVGAEVFGLNTPSETELARRERQRVAHTGVVNYAWDAKSEHLLVLLSGVPHIVNVDSGVLSKVVDGDDITDARFSPTGAWVSFVRDGSLHMVPSAHGSPLAVSPPSSDGMSFGVAEFVAQEEFGRDTGYWWSSDETRIAYTRVDESSVPIARLAEVGLRGVEVVDRRFPFAGGPNAAVSLFIGQLDGGPPIEVELGRRDIYLARVDWSLDGGVLYVQRQSRDQRTLDILAVEPATGESRILLTEHQAPWINLNLEFQPLRDGGFLWASERTGYLHLYRYDADGRLLHAVTQGALPLVGRDRARALVGLDESRQLAYVMASTDGGLERHLFAASLDEPRPLRQLTAGAGQWTISMSPRADAYLGRFSAPDTPPRTGVFDLNGKLHRWISHNPLDDTHPYYPHLRGLPDPEFGKLDAEDGQRLDFVLRTPRAFDPARRYPAIVVVYGGPGRQHVARSWRPPAERVFLDAGFVLFQLDNRGASGRGLAFEAPIHLSLGGPEVRDQLVGLSYLRGLPFVDAERIGVMGWSYGGYMTLRLMTERGGGFAAGAAGAAPSDWRRYDTHYTEHYMGDPRDQAEAYDRASILPRLKDLEGRLLLMHGMADDNVLFANAVEIIADLQSSGKVFDLMLYPGQRHGIAGEALKLHQHLTYLDFFRRTLGSASHE